MARTIVWEECENAEAARLKENLLLRTHCLRFNVRNTYPQSYRFITVRGDSDTLILNLGAELKSEEKVYGSFKSEGGGLMAFFCA